MSSNGFYFGGRQYQTPTAVSAVDESAMADTATAIDNNLAIVGPADHGQPGVVLTFDSASAARAALVSGDALAAIEKAFDPSSETGGPALVRFVRVGAATQSIASLSDASTVAVLNLATEDYGVQSVGAQVKVEAGTTQGVKVTVKSGGVSYVGDNLYAAPLSVAYSGGGSTPTVQVSPTALTLKVAGTAVATLPFTSYATVQSLVDAINATAGFAATLGAGFGGTSPANLFDLVTALAVTSTPANLTATNVAVAAWFNGPAQSVVNATLVPGGAVVAPTTGFVVLAGGSSPTITNTDWSNAFDLLQTEDVQWVVPISSSAAIHAMASAHCAYMSTVGMSERRAFCGTALGTSNATAIAEAFALNDDRTALVNLGVYDFDVNGNLTLFAPYVLAAQIAGMFAGSAPGTPMTNKTLKCQGFERKLKVPTDTDVLLKGGVLPVHTSRKGFVVTQSVSTWIANANYNRVEISTGVALDTVCRALRDELSNIIGQTGSPKTLAQAVSRGETVLTNLAKEAPIGPGLLVGDAKNPPFKNLRASLSGNAVVFEAQVSPAIPVNYVGIVVHAVPFSGTASA